MSSSRTNCPTGSKSARVNRATAEERGPTFSGRPPVFLIFLWRRRLLQGEGVGQLDCETAILLPNAEDVAGLGVDDEQITPGAVVIAESDVAEQFAIGPADNTAPDVPEATADSSRSRGAFSLATFVVGPSNECAFRAIELTARGRQQASPVFVWGSTGGGKTHLLRAMVREHRRHYPRAAAVYLSAEQFTTGYVDAVRGSGLPSFRQKCRGAELLVIDDLLFLVP